MANQFNISQLFKEVFNVSGVAYNPSFEDSTEPINANYNLQLDDKDANLPHSASFMGTPILFPWQLDGGEYFTYNNYGEVERKEMDNFRMPAATLCSFSRAKIVRTTKVSGARGTVKEMYGFDDWRIRIQGIMIDESNHPQAISPFDQKERLLQFENLTDAISVTGEIFESLRIASIVIQDIKFRQLQGKPRMIPFEMSCVSDEPLELLL